MSRHRTGRSVPDTIIKCALRELDEDPDTIRNEWWRNVPDRLGHIDFRDEHWAIHILHAATPDRTEAIA